MFEFKPYGEDEPWIEIAYDGAWLVSPGGVFATLDTLPDDSGAFSITPTDSALSIWRAHYPHQEGKAALRFLSELCANAARGWEQEMRDETCI